MGTDTIPMQNTPMTAIFCLVFMFSWRTVGTCSVKSQLYKRKENNLHVTTRRSGPPYRDQEYDHIRHNIDSRVGKPETLFADALVGGRRVPESRDGNAEEDGGEDASDSVTYADAHHEPTEFCNLGPNEESEEL